MANQYISVSSSQSTNAAGNQSTVYVSMTLYSNGWSFDGYTTGFGLRIGDAWYQDTGPRTLYNPNSWTVSWSRTYNHDANGFRGAVDTEGYFDGTGPYMPDYLSAGGGTQGAVDYDRRPAQPSYCNNTLEANKTLTASWNAVSSPAGTPTYYVQYASAAAGAGYGGWSGEYSTTGTSYNFNLPRAATHKFRVRAANSDGGTGYTESGGVYVPSGGKIFNGSSFVLTSFARKFNGSSWVDLQIARRFDGSNWVDIS